MVEHIVACIAEIDNVPLTCHFYLVKDGYRLDVGCQQPNSAHEFVGFPGLGQSDPALAKSAVGDVHQIELNGGCLRCWRRGI